MKGMRKATVAVLAAAALAGCSEGKPAPVDPVQSAADFREAMGTVTYEVTLTGGSDSASDRKLMVTYSTESGTAQDDTYSSPWTFERSGAGFLYVSAQQSTYGTVRCRILRGDEVLAENESTAEYGIVTCQA